MTRAQLFRILRKINIACIVIMALLIPVGVVLTVMGLEGALGIADLEEIIGVGGLLILIPVVFIIALAINSLILRIVAASQSTVLIIFMIVLEVVLGLAMETVSIPLFYILALFLPKE